MDSKTIIARIRQLAAADKNAVDVYSSLVDKVSDDNAKKIILTILEDEKRHVKMSAQMIELLKS